MNQYDYQKFHNPDHEDFVGKWGGEEYLIKAGDTVPFPPFLVNHFSEKLADKIMLRDHSSSSYKDAKLREPYITAMKGAIIVPKVEEEKKPDGVKVREQIEKETAEFADLERIKQEDEDKKKLEALEKANEIKAKRIAALQKAREAKKNKSSK